MQRAPALPFRGRLRLQCGAVATSAMVRDLDETLEELGLAAALEFCGIARVMGELSCEDGQEPEVLTEVLERPFVLYGVDGAEQLPGDWQGRLHRRLALLLDLQIQRAADSPDAAALQQVRDTLPAVEQADPAAYLRSQAERLGDSAGGLPRQSCERMLDGLEPAHSETSTATS